MNKVIILFLGLLFSFQSFALTPYKGSYDLYAETVMGNLKIGTAILNLEINNNQFEFTTEASTAKVWKALYDYSRSERSIGNEIDGQIINTSFSVVEKMKDEKMEERPLQSTPSSPPSKVVVLRNKAMNAGRLVSLHVKRILVGNPKIHVVLKHVLRQHLEWLRRAKKKYGIPVITEVMEEKYLPLVSEVADIIQIGSRNMQNFPFLTACAKTQKPLMLKRHFGCSLRDWLGAAEYILYEGNKKVLLCERGVSAPHTHRSTSRFLLDLQVVPAAKEVTHLPIIVDPSHATFWRPWIESMSLASVAAGADGVMLEVHPDPENSAVDPLQPINYKDFKNLIKKMDILAKKVMKKTILS